MHFSLLSLFFFPMILGEDILLKTKCSLENLAPCPYDPDADLTTPQIARRHGYPAQSHFITTEDGYILTIHRIPGSKTGKKGSQPVFLQHGLLTCSTCFVSADNASLAFLLADAGYDVWMGNARGNIYSKAHMNLSIHSSQYWDFSFHEMGIYDLPAALSYVSKVTNKPGEIIYVGHSMGTTMFFVFAAMRPEIAKTVKLMVALAPVAYMTHIRTPLRYLAPFVYDLQWLAKYLGINEFLPNTQISKILSHDCELLKIDQVICDNMIFTLCGIDKREFRPELLSLFVAKNPAGSSTKAVVHYGQEVDNEGIFQQFDYGPKRNLVKYGRPTPPEYKLLDIKVKTFLMFSKDDQLASYIDAIRLSYNLTNLVGLHEVTLPGFDHVAFIVGKDAVELVYKPLMEVMRHLSEGAEIYK